METIGSVVAWLLANWQVLLGIIVGLFTVALAIAKLFPGDNPDSFLQKCLDFLGKFKKE